MADLKDMLIRCGCCLSEEMGVVLGTFLRLPASWLASPEGELACSLECAATLAEGAPVADTEAEAETVTLGEILGETPGQTAPDEDPEFLAQLTQLLDDEPAPPAAAAAPPPAAAAAPAEGEESRPQTDHQLAPPEARAEEQTP